MQRFLPQMRINLKEKLRQQLIHDYVISIYDEILKVLATTDHDYYYIVLDQDPIRDHDSAIEIMNRLTLFFPDMSVYLRYNEKGTDNFVDFGYQDADMLPTVVVSWAN